MKETQSLRSVQRRYASSALLVAVVAGAACIGTGHPAIGKGLILGCILSVINFILIGRNIVNRAPGSQKQLMTRSLSSIGLRFFIMGAGLLAGIKMESLNVFAVAAGLFTVQAAIMLDHLVVARFRSAGRKGS